MAYVDFTCHTSCTPLQADPFKSTPRRLIPIIVSEELKRPSKVLYNLNLLTRNVELIHTQNWTHPWNLIIGIPLISVCIHCVLWMIIPIPVITSAKNKHSDLKVLPNTWPGGFFKFWIKYALKTEKSPDTIHHLGAKTFKWLILPSFFRCFPVVKWSALCPGGSINRSASSDPEKLSGQNPRQDPSTMTNQRFGRLTVGFTCCLRKSMKILETKRLLMAEILHHLGWLKPYK